MVFGTAPEFWWHQTQSAKAMALRPVAALYGAVAGRRMQSAKSVSAPIPVICIGNLTLGGSGKTPLAIELFHAAKAQGFRPGFITRGHGGSLTQTQLVDVNDTASLIGDEAKMLFSTGPVAVGPDRVAAAHLLYEAGYTLAIMDDGFQSRTLVIDHAILAVDAKRSIGNGLVFPAGPLRAPLDLQLRFADQIIVTGDGGAADSVVRLASRAGKPVARATFEATHGHNLRGVKVLAFAGIADPGKFFATLASTGAELVEQRSFADHYAYQNEDLQALMDDAKQAGLTLVTTEKDAARFLGLGDIGEQMRGRTRVLAVRLRFSDDAALSFAIDNARAKFRKRAL
jgi:tetraacyldisaccharide 4'-kinase